MKKVLLTIMGALTSLTLLTGCGSSSEEGFSTDNDITIVSREEGSGTRDAFVGIFGVEEKDGNGKKIDKTTDEASITNNTSVMMTTVAGDSYAIGYISLGVLDDTVKAVNIDGVEPTAKNVQDGSYKVSRPFVIATKDGISPVTQDFINYILSSDGQGVIESKGYISVGESKAYESTNPSGKVVVAGSSSVSPVMEKLKEAYLEKNPNVTIEIQTSDSTTGISSASNGVCDIGMSSRELKDSEKGSGLKSTKIAIDGIAVIVNNDNTIDDLTKDQVKDIYLGNSKSWSDIEK